MLKYLGILFLLICLFITFYVCGYILLYGAILELILGNILWSLLRCAWAVVLSYLIWSFKNGIWWIGVWWLYSE